MSNVHIHILTNVFWAVVFGVILAGISFLFWRKRSMISKVRAVIVLLLCVVQCIGKALLAFLYGSFQDPISSQFEIYEIIFLLSSLIQYATCFLIIVFLLSILASRLKRNGS